MPRVSIGTGLGTLRLLSVTRVSSCSLALALFALVWCAHHIACCFLRPTCLCVYASALRCAIGFCHALWGHSQAAKLSHVMPKGKIVAAALTQRCFHLRQKVAADTEALAAARREVRNEGYGVRG